MMPSRPHRLTLGWRPRACHIAGMLLLNGVTAITLRSSVGSLEEEVEAAADRLFALALSEGACSADLHALTVFVRDGISPEELRAGLRSHHGLRHTCISIIEVPSLVRSWINVQFNAIFNLQTMLDQEGGSSRE